MDIDIENPIVAKLVDRFPEILALDYWQYSDEVRGFRSIDDELQFIAKEAPEKLRPFQDGGARSALKLALELSGYRCVSVPEIASEPVEVLWFLSDCGEYLKRQCGEDEEIRTIAEWIDDKTVTLPTEILNQLESTKAP